MTSHSAVHDTFRIDRHFDASPDRVFHAFADPAAKARWFGGPAEMKREDESFDFREGGRETMVTVFDDGTRYGFYATYVDIVPAERIVYTYEMTMNGQRISASVVTVEVRGGQAGGTDFAVVEQGVYLDGLDNSAQRRQGTEDLMDALGKSLS
ncbi:SRPBCC domain-containing protein [Paractinoplanes durhamensis]|uniref:Activator of HSP90 ATPase n=1 Tax=Paractinoplanes durhamensis TaxID=113563 RepID=A0ABQ3Z487_9ACTN|nr:SRPBCC domain-containing protein [Actinoplanes durhamensis]GIE04640.1 activator of HSP90 ATPase [Actinoplanes durhamensis]